MALIETWLNCDTTKLVTVKALNGNVFSADNEGNLIGVYVSKKGQPVELSGSVIGYVIRPDGETVAVPGSLSGNRAWIVLPLSAYAVVGQISIAIRIVNGSEKTVLAACTGYVNRTTTDTIIDPGHIIPSLEELLAQIEACETATEAATAAARAANTAASNADTKAALANTAAGNAEEKATIANKAAGRADDAAAALENMTGTATGLAAGEDPTVNITKEDGHYTIDIGVPKGDTGEVAQAEFDALAEEVDQKAPAVFKTIESTPIATFDDGADEMPLKDLKVAIEPVQDLHGYDHPWPAGGGKNKWPLGDITEAQTRVPVSFPAGTYVMSGVGTNNANIRFHYADETSTLVTSAVGKSFELTADCVSINIALTGTDDITNVQLEAGTTPTAYEPYSNICPISGWTGAKVTRTGKNLLNCTRMTGNGNYNSSIVDITTDGFSLYGTNGTSTSGSYGKSTCRFTDIKGPMTVTIRGKYTNQNSGMNPHPNGNINFGYGTATSETTSWDDLIFPNSQITIGTLASGTFTFVVNIPAGAYLCFAGTARNRDASTTLSGELILSEVQVEIGSSATVYESFKANDAYSIAFPSEAGTVYGGTLDVTSGVLTVDRKTVVIDGSVTGWETGYGNANYVPLTRFTSDQVKQAATGVERSALCLTNRFKPISSSWSESLTRNNEVCFGVATDDYFVFNTGVRISDVPAWLNENPIIFVYKLATPITYQLTLQEVATLLGLNHVWADTGDINLLTYPVDTAIKVENVDKRIISVLSAIVAPVLTDMIADTALTVNQFRIVNDTLYKVTAPIASGGTLTPGTNVIATSIGEQITALLNA